MSILKLKGSTSGYVELTAPATAGNNTITLPVTAGTVAVRDASNNTEVGTGVTVGSPASNTFTVSTAGSERIRIDSSGRLAVGTTSASVRLHVNVDSASETDVARFQATNGADIQFLDIGVDATNNFVSYDSTGSVGGAHIFRRGGGEVMRLDDASRMLVGTPSARSNFFNTNYSSTVQIEGAGTGINAPRLSIVSNTNSSVEGPMFILARANGTTVGSATVVSNNDFLGGINFQGSDGTEFCSSASINAFVDSTPGVDDMPGRLVFSTTADGAASPTERMRITSAGLVGIGVSSPSSVLDLNGSLSISGKTTDVGPARITHHTNNYFYVRGGTAGAVLSDQAGNNTVRVENSGTILFETNNGSERARIDSSGRFLIGTTSGAGDARLQVVGNTGGDPGRIDIRRNADNPVANSEIGTIRFSDLNGESGQYATIQCFADAASTSSGDLPGRLVFSTTADGASSPTERMRIDSNGQLAIGAAGVPNTPRLSVRGNNNLASGQAVIPSTYCGVVISSSSGGSVDNGGAIWFDHGDLFSGIAGSRVSTGNWGTDLRFYTHPDSTSNQYTLPERMRITSSGTILQGTTTSNGGGAGIECTSITSTSSALLLNQTNPTAGTTHKLITGYRGVFGVSAAETFIVYNNGNVQNTNNSYGAISDIKLKENIVDATSQWSDIKSLQVRKYNFKEGQTHTQIGLIAQEVELVSPGLVTESPARDAKGNDLGTTTKSVNYSVLYMKAVKALQEAMERIETLESKVAALESA